jgi:hypothetical protein
VGPFTDVVFRGMSRELIKQTCLSLLSDHGVTSDANADELGSSQSLLILVQFKFHVISLVDSFDDVASAIQ